MKRSSMGASFFSKYRDLIIVSFLLVTPVVFYLANAKETREHNLIDRALLTVSAPIQWLMVTSFSAVSDVWSSYIALVNLQEENTKLRGVNRSLRRELLIRKEQALENSRLRRLLSLQEQSPSMHGVVAEVVSMSPTPIYRRVRINRGSEEGISIGAGVVNDLGVVGRVIAVAARWADVMLLADVNCSIDVVVQRTRAFARVRGRGRDSVADLDIEYLERTADVEPGDILVTSGLGQIFPKGLEVGDIAAVERGAHGLYQKVEIKPAANFDQLETVLVLSPAQVELDATKALESLSSGIPSVDGTGSPAVP